MVELQAPSHKDLIIFKGNDKTGSEPTKLRTRPCFLGNPTSLLPCEAFSERDSQFPLSLLQDDLETTAKALTVSPYTLS
jgi:hypothetical protein